MSDSSSKSNSPKPATSGFTTTSEQPAVKSVAESLQELGEKAKEVGQSVQEEYERLTERARDAMNEGRSKAIAWESDVERAVREKPIKSLLVATAVGFLFAVLFMD